MASSSDTGWASLTTVLLDGQHVSSILTQCLFLAHALKNQVNYVISSLRQFWPCSSKLNLVQNLQFKHN